MFSCNHKEYRVPQQPESPSRSSELAPNPHPLHRQRVRPPQDPSGGGGPARACGKGVGGANSHEKKDTRVLCMPY
jgi:hypothetical protein